MATQRFVDEQEGTQPGFQAGERLFGGPPRPPVPFHADEAQDDGQVVAHAVVQLPQQVGAFLGVLVRLFVKAVVLLGQLRSLPVGLLEGTFHAVRP